MITFEKTVHINRPQREVFEFVSDPTNDALYPRGVKFAEWSTEGPVGLGSTMRTVDRFIGREVKTVSEITTRDPPNKYAFKTVDGSFPVRFTLSFESTDEGTELTSRGEIEFRGLLKVVEWLFGKQIENQAQTDFDTLKLVFEGGR